MVARQERPVSTTVVQVALLVDGVNDPYHTY
jgi:hypothetical protein